MIVGEVRGPGSSQVSEIRFFFLELRYDPIIFERPVHVEIGT